MTVMHRSSGLFLLAFLLTASVSLAQVTQPRPGAVQPTPGAVQPRPGGAPPRDRGPSLQQQTGTAAISGRVTSADTGMPIRRVQVRVSSSDLRGTRMTMTDTEGRFTITSLPAGRYSLYFIKSGYVNLSFGQSRPNQGSKIIELSDGQKMEKADVALPRGGVIAGRLFDDYGDPVVDARVQVMQYRWANNARRLANMGRMSQTNDRGEFRIWGLPPGEYYVAASNQERMMMFMDSAPAGPPDPSESQGYASTYYPGTASPSEAQRVTLAAGQEVTGIDFALVTTRTVRVSGTVVTSEGRPVGNSGVMLMPRTPLGGVMSPQGTRTDAQGAFTISGVTPGEYVLQARTDDRMGFGPGNGTAEMAFLPINVGSEDLRNVTLTTSSGSRVSGRVVFDTPPPAGTMERVRVFLQPVDPEQSMGMGMMGGPEDGRVTEQGTFEMRGVFGRRTARIVGLPEGFALRAVRVGGDDVIDSGFEFGKDDVRGLQLLVTTRITTITGSARGADNKPATDYVVIAFPTDDDVGLRPGSRYLGFARPDQNGGFRLRALPPGSYFIVALDAMPEEMGNPDVFEQLKGSATRVMLNEGAQEHVELTVHPAPSPAG